MKPKIFVFPNTRWNGGDIGCYAIAEDGTVLAAHISSTIYWAKFDMGITSGGKHEAYQGYYPEGFLLEWIDDNDVPGHVALKAAIDANANHAITFSAQKGEADAD